MRSSVSVARIAAHSNWNSKPTSRQRARLNLAAVFRAGDGTYLLATRDVAAGEELLWDYGADYWHERGWSYALDVADDDMDLASPAARAARCAA